jgi:periplasmic protein CpxP/Spy
MKEKIPLVMAIAAGFALLTGFAFHGGWGPGARGHDPARMGQMVTAHLDEVLDDLKATDAQRTQILALKDKLLQDGQQRFAANRDAHQKLVAEWDSAQPNPAQIHAIIDARIDALRAMAHETADAAIQFHGILTPEQRAQVSKKVHRRME